MNKDEITAVIEAALRSGNRTPGVFDLPGVLRIRSELQSCTSIHDVLGIIQQHRKQISKAFGLSDDAIDRTLEKLKALDHH